MESGFLSLSIDIKIEPTEALVCGSYLLATLMRQLTVKDTININFNCLEQLKFVDSE